MNDDRKQVENSGASGCSVSGVIVDWNAALSVAAGDVDLLLEMLEAFQIETPQLIQSIEQAMESGDAPLLHRAAHTLKNCYYNIGARPSGDIAFELEELGEKSAFDQVSPLFEQLKSHATQIQAEVDRFLRERGRG